MRAALARDETMRTVTRWDRSASTPAQLTSSRPGPQREMPSAASHWVEWVR